LLTDTIRQLCNLVESLYKFGDCLLEEIAFDVFGLDPQDFIVDYLQDLVGGNEVILFPNLIVVLASL
jgi:hypothetical protein